MVCRRYWSINLKEVRKLGTAQGGRYLDGTRFQFAGGQIRSFLSLISYYGKGEMRERYLGVKIPPTNLKPDFLGQAQAFANKLADSLDGGRVTSGGMSTWPTSRSTAASYRSGVRRLTGDQRLGGSQPDWSLIKQMKPREGPRRCRWC